MCLAEEPTLYRVGAMVLWSLPFPLGSTAFCRNSRSIIYTEKICVDKSNTWGSVKKICIQAKKSVGPGRDVFESCCWMAIVVECQPCRTVIIGTLALLLWRPTGGESPSKVEQNETILLACFFSGTVGSKGDWSLILHTGYSGICRIWKYIKAGNTVLSTFKLPELCSASWFVCISGGFWILHIFAIPYAVPGSSLPVAAWYQILVCITITQGDVLELAHPDCSRAYCFTMISKVLE